MVKRLQNTFIWLLILIYFGRTHHTILAYFGGIQHISCNKQDHNKLWLFVSWPTFSLWRVTCLLNNILLHNLSIILSNTIDYSTDSSLLRTLNELIVIVAQVKYSSSGSSQVVTLFHGKWCYWPVTGLQYSCITAVPGKRLTPAPSSSSIVILYTLQPGFFLE